MRYFLDTEFNGFGGALISIALAPEDLNAPSFYAALHCADPTPWVAAHVLPVLHVEQIEREVLGRMLADYLSDDPDPALIADWPEDIAHAAMALIKRPGVRHPIARVRFELCDPPGFDPSAQSTVPHNALADAIAFREYMLTRGCG